MSPTAFMVLCVLTVLTLVGMFQIPFVTDVLATTGYSTTEIFSGIAAILFFFYTLIGIFTVRA